MVNLKRLKTGFSNDKKYFRCKKCYWIYSVEPLLVEVVKDDTCPRCMIVDEMLKEEGIL